MMLDLSWDTLERLTQKRDIWSKDIFNGLCSYLVNVRLNIWNNWGPIFKGLGLKHNNWINKVFSVSQSVCCCFRFFWQQRDGGGWSNCDGALLHVPCRMRISHPAAPIKQQTHHGKPPKTWERRQQVKWSDTWSSGYWGTTFLWCRYADWQF